MKYTQLLKPEFVDEYKKRHRELCSAFCNMIFDVVYLKKCVELQNVNYDLKTIFVAKRIHQNHFEYLVAKMFRHIFDKGGDAVTIGSFQDKIMSNCLSADCKSYVIDRLKNITWSEPQFENIRRIYNDRIYELRTKVIAHWLDKPLEDFTVDLSRMEEILDAACELFMALSFEPDDLYSSKWDSRYFENEKAGWGKEIEMFVRSDVINSEYITRIFCEYDEILIADEIKASLQNEINEINSAKGF